MENKVNCSKYPTTTITAEQKAENDSCMVCFETYVVGESQIKVLPCGHFLHPDCLERWTDESPTCVICRYRLPIERIYPSYDSSWFNFVYPTSTPVESSLNTPATSNTSSSIFTFRERSNSRGRSSSNNRRRQRNRHRSSNRGRSPSRKGRSQSRRRH